MGLSLINQPTVTPSCAGVTNGVCTDVDKDVFTIDSVIGDPFDTNSTCKNLAFVVGAEGALGEFQLIPNNVSQSLTLGPADPGVNNYCNIQLNLSVQKVPKDSTPGTPAIITTFSGANAKFQGLQSGLTATASGGTVTAVQAPDLHIVKTPDAQTIQAGDTATFTVHITNTGGGPAINVILNDPLPNVSGGLNWTLSPPVSGCAIDNTNFPNQVLKCDQLGIPAGGAVDLIVSTATSPLACGQMDNTASITGTNNFLHFNPPLQDDGHITCSQKAGLTKSFNPTSIQIGGTTTLTFTITNPAANNPAQVVSFTDTLPSKLQIAAIPNIQNTCTGGTVTANAGATTITVANTTVGAIHKATVISITAV